MRKEKILEKAITTWGYDAQADMLIEEMSEVTKAVLKLRRGMNSNSFELYQIEGLKDNVLEELADVSLMIDQILFQLDPDRSIFNHYIKYKLDRLEERLK